MSQTSTTDLRETELVLPPGVFAFVLDSTKGNVTTYCGPTKSSLSQTDQPVTYDHSTGRFRPCSIDHALQTNIVARKGEYIVLKNSANNGSHPDAGKAEVLSPSLLNFGTVENVSGPINFALWPGQSAEVIPGHHLRSNQYVIARVYDEEAARANWNDAVVKPATGDGDGKKTEEKQVLSDVVGVDVSTLTIGKLIVIKGTSVSFYVPPTGIEVLRNEDGEGNNNYVRDAVTLERLEYCILLGENGTKRYVRGPEVVFPEPTEQFVVSSDKGKRKFRAYELNENSGLYIKVIADYDGHKAGDEMFITGADTAIYYPQPEHAIIKYGDQDKHYAIAVPAGEARYVLKRDTGEVTLITGPKMFLPDPRKEVMVRRILDERTCELYYPGNLAVAEYNRKLREVAGDSEYAADSNFESFGAAMAASNLDDGGGGNFTRGYSKIKRKLAAKSEFADDFTRGTAFTPPRTITLSTKLDGAVTVDVWTGFAVQVVNKIGDRRVVQGPQSVMLEYDEYLEGMSLSRGRPKDSDNTLSTVYLRTMSNAVTDTIQVSTNDLVDLVIDLKYLVRFSGDESKWFNVDNYVQYMCDHMRSLIGNQVRQDNIQNFYSNAVERLRDIVLGSKVEGESRANKHFDENGMEIYDLEVISIKFVDRDIEYLLSESRQDELKNTIELESEQRRLVLITGQEEARRAIAGQEDKTADTISKFTLKGSERDAAERMARVDFEHAESLRREEGRLLTEQEASKRRALSLSDDKNRQDQVEEFARAELVRTIEQLVAEAAADATRMKAVQPALIGALQSMAMTGTLQQMAEHLAPLSIVRNESLSGTLTTMLKGTPMEHLLENIQNIGPSQFLGPKSEDVDDEGAA